MVWCSCRNRQNVKWPSSVRQTHREKNYGMVSRQRRHRYSRRYWPSSWKKREIMKNLASAEEILRCERVVFYAKQLKTLEDWAKQFSVWGWQWAYITDMMACWSLQTLSIVSSPIDFTKLWKWSMIISLSRAARAVAVEMLSQNDVPQCILNESLLKYLSEEVTSLHHRCFYKMLWPLGMRGKTQAI